MRLPRGARRAALPVLGLLLLAALPLAQAAGGGFTRVSNDGNAVTDDTPLGLAPGEWACTRDESTGLMWEVKTTDAGLRDRRWTYTPYDSNPETNGGWEGYRDTSSGRCVRDAMDGRSCNTEAYVKAVNAAGLCGHQDWRLPTVRELTTVAWQTSRASPRDTVLALPNTADGWYWTGVEHVGITSFSRVILLPTAGRPHFYDGSYMVMVVREDRAVPTMADN